MEYIHGTQCNSAVAVILGMQAPPCLVRFPNYNPTITLPNLKLNQAKRLKVYGGMRARVNMKEDGKHIFQSIVAKEESVKR